MDNKYKPRRHDIRTVAVRVALFGTLLSLAVLFGYIETLIPISIGIPGAKLGLANLVNMVSLYLIGTGGTIRIALARIILINGFTYGNMAMMIYSLAGGGLSLLLMILCRKRDWFGQVGVSIIGGVGHNIGQILVAAAVMESSNIFYYLPFLLVSGTVAGTMIGLLGGIVTKRLESILQL